MLSYPDGHVRDVNGPIDSNVHVYGRQMTSLLYQCNIVSQRIQEHLGVYFKTTSVKSNDEQNVYNLCWWDIIVESIMSVRVE